jgi:hypothetical protein
MAKTSSPPNHKYKQSRGLMPKAVSIEPALYGAALKHGASRFDDNFSQYVRSLIKADLSKKGAA